VTIEGRTRRPITLQLDPWDLTPDSGDADGKFDGEVIGVSKSGHWIVELNRSIRDSDGDHGPYVVLCPRYLGQPVIAKSAAFPYMSASMFLSREEAHDATQLERLDLSKIPGYVCSVYLR
jgi:hypothetical protein